MEAEIQLSRVFKKNSTRKLHTPKINNSYF